MMRLTALLASVALVMPALALASGYSTPRNPHHYGGNGWQRAKPPKLPYKPLPPSWHVPPRGTPVGYLPNVNYGQNSNTNSNQNAVRNENRNSNANSNQIANRNDNRNSNTNSNQNANRNDNRNSNANSNRNRNSALAGAAALAGATAGASATGGTASIGNVSTGPSTATASNSNSNNADNSSNLSSSVRVEGDTYIQARNRRIPVSTAYAAPLTSGIDTCLGSASAGVQTGILGVSLGGTKRDRICETIKLSRELHHMGMREGAVQLLCIDERVRIAMRNAGTPCEAVTYEPPMAYDEPPPPIEYAPPPPRRRRGERG